MWVSDYFFLLWVSIIHAGKAVLVWMGMNRMTLQRPDRPIFKPEGEKMF